MFAKYWVVFIWWYLFFMVNFYVFSHYVHVKSDLVVFGTPIIISLIATFASFF